MRRRFSLLAALNLTIRLGSETVTEWDESLYAISAWEMETTGNIVATTFLGALDYYNSKPPLNVWLIALSFKAFGIGLVSLRLVSVISAWLTVAVLLEWARRAFGPAVALFAALVLSTTFGFFYVHSGRSAETDALFTLLVLLTVVTLWAEQRQPWRRLWLGPVAAAVFLLRGTAVLMPIAIIMAVSFGRKRTRQVPWQATAVACLLFVIPVGAWAIARWRIDRWRFFDLMLNYDLVARSLTVIEEHPGGPLYYLNILQKHHYDWLLAGTAALLLSPIPWRQLRERVIPFWQGDDGLGVLMGSWAGVTLLVPTVMRTKLPWYLNPFYPVFALGIAWLLVKGLSIDWHGELRRRGLILAGVIVLCFGVAEGKMIWYSYAVPRHRRFRAGHAPQGAETAQGSPRLLRRVRPRRHLRREWSRRGRASGNGSVRRFLAREPRRRLLRLGGPAGGSESRTRAHRPPPVALLPPGIGPPLADDRQAAPRLDLEPFGIFLHRFDVPKRLRHRLLNDPQDRLRAHRQPVVNPQPLAPRLDQSRPAEIRQMA